MAESFERMLTGGHPNSLGRTLEVVEQIFANKNKLKRLYACYFSEDEVVRLRTSSAFKRVARERSDWLIPYIEGFLTEIAKIDQASTQWTLASLFDMLVEFMEPKQRSAALRIMKKNLEKQHDWIVLNTTMQVLADWSATDKRLHTWLKPHLKRLSKDSRKSVANRAKKLLAKLYA